MVSYLTAWPSRDVVTLGNQVATREWWRDAPSRFELVVSPFVSEESSVGDPETARARLAALESVRVVRTGDHAAELGRALVVARAFPAQAAADAVHAAIAALNGVDYLVTWNMRHLANPVAAARIEQVCRDAGHEPPVICTPSQLMSSRIRDPIVEEVRRVRAEIAARHGNDVASIIRHVQALERTLGRPCVSYPPRPVVHTDEGAAVADKRGGEPPPVAKAVRPSPTSRAPNGLSAASPPREPS